MTDLDLCILGPMQARVDGQQRAIRGTHRRTILALLALEVGKPVPRDRIIEQVWGTAPPNTARSSLRVHITNLRRDLGAPDLIVSAEHGYYLDVAADAVDVHRFTELARSGRRSLVDGDHADASRDLALAADLWHDPVLPDLERLGVAASHRTHLERLHDDLVVDLAEARLHADPGAPDVTSLEELVDHHPFDERAWALLMTALYRSGRQADALTAYQRARGLLLDEMGLEPGPALADLEARILDQDPTLDAVAKAAVDLPSFPTSYVGRATEIVDVAALIDRLRLVTITGMGGAGKTRLAVEAARTRADRFPDGVVFVPLEQVSDPSLIPAALGSRFDVESDDLDAVAAAIGPRDVLVLVDNAEQVLAGLVDVVDHLLRACPDVRLLVTSRLPLGMTGEAVWSIPPLATPEDVIGASDADILAADAVTLFVERAHQARPDLDLGPQKMRTIAQICQDLAGLPLGIELAAAQVRVRSLDEIASRLRADTAALASSDRDRPERHSGLDASVRWTLDLLDPEHRTVFRRLSVFRDPIDMEGVAAIRGEPAPESVPLDTLVGDLVQASLVQADVSGPRATFSLLPPVRQVAVNELARSDDHAHVLTCHLGHVATMAAGAATAVGGPEEAAAFERLDAHSADVRGALSHAREADPSTFVQLCVDLGRYWLRRRLHREARGWVEHAITVCDPAETATYATLLHTAGALAFDDADLDEAERLLGKALAIREELHDAQGQATTLNNLAGVASDAGNHAAARQRWEDAAALFEAVGHDHGVAATRCNLGIVTSKLGLLDEADDHLHTALEVARRSGNRVLEALALERRGYVAAQLGELERARALAQAAHEIHDRHSHHVERARSHWNLAMCELTLGEVDAACQPLTTATQILARERILDAWWVSGLIETAACVLAETGQDRLAARLLGTATINRHRQGLPDSQFTMVDLARVRQELSERLGVSTYGTEWTVGSALTAGEALEEIVVALDGVHAGR